MTAATATDAAAAVTGISDQELAALIEGGWRDDRTDTPGWERAVKVGGGRRMRQKVFAPAFAYGNGWKADSEGEVVWRDSLDQALAWCDEQAGDRKPAEPGSATEQEDRFASLTAAS